MFFDRKMNGRIVCGNTEISCETIQEQISKYRDFITPYAVSDIPVALLLPRGEIYTLCMLTLLEASIPFLPIDLEMPKNRMEYMLKNVGAEYVISTFEYGRDLTIDGVTVVFWEDIVLRVSNKGAIRSESKAYAKSNIAYYLFTSGSTGKPKAVPILRSALYNFVCGIQERIPAKSGQRILHLTSISFDISFLELVYALYSGLTVVIVSEYTKNHIKDVCNEILDKEVDIVQMTPSRLKMIKIVDEKYSCLRNVQTILVGGEMLPPQLASDLLKYTNARLFNMYGPTETTIWSSCGEIISSEDIHIGTPILNTDFYILDENLDEVMEGTRGEICIGGAGLSSGYCNNSIANSKAFVNLKQGKRVYKTGDYGCYKNGKFYCLGRIDNQIKVNGHRIELEDIDSNIEGLGLVKQVVTCYSEEKNALVSYYIAESIVDKDAFLGGLKPLIPEYMIPKYYVYVEKFIYTISNKVDRNSMVKDFGLGKHSEKTENKARDDYDRAIIDIFERQLETMVNEQDNIEEIVFDSVAFISIIVEIEGRFEIEFDGSMLEKAAFKTVQDVIDYTKNLLK